MAAATEKQIPCVKWIAKELGVPCPSVLSKEDASKYITKHLEAAREHKINRLFDREMRRLTRRSRGRLLL